MLTRRETAPLNNERIKPLIEAVRAVIISEALLIAKGLAKSAKKGRPMAARLMIDLAQKDVDIEEAIKTNPLRSLALRLAAQPQLPPEALSSMPIEPTP